MSTDVAPTYLTGGDVARMAPVSRKTVYRAIASGALPSVPPLYNGGARGITTEAAQQWIAARCPTRVLTDSDDATTRAAS